MNFRWDCRADGCLAEGSFHSDVKAIDPKGGANGGLVSDWQLQFEFCELNFVYLDFTCTSIQE